MINTLIALPYELARLPWTVVDHSLSTKLPETSGPRVALDRALGSADKAVGTLLHNRDLTKRGTDRLERSDKLVSAVRLEKEASVRREQARATAAEGGQEAAQKRKAAQDKAASGLQEADVAEARGKQEAKAKATKTAAQKKAAADKRAASQKATAEKRKAAKADAAEAEKKAAQKDAKAELDEARETKKAAAETREDAERLSDLTEAKKQERKQD